MRGIPELSVESDTQQYQKLDEFAKLLEFYTPTRARRGRYLRGTVMQVDDDAVLFDVGAKRDAILSKYEMAKTNPSILQEIQLGTTLPLYVLRAPVGTNPLEVSIERARHLADWERAQLMMEAEEALEVVITGWNKGGLTARFGELRGFLPRSHVPGLRRIPEHEREKAQNRLIGTKLKVMIVEVNRHENNLILSGRRALALGCRDRLKELRKGDVVDGMVVSIVDYGAFVDVGGAAGLLHISEIDHRHIDHPSDVLDVYERLKVSVKNVDLERERISLSRKALLPNPWEVTGRTWSVGDLLLGEVIKRNKAGLVIELSKGIKGLVPAEELDPRGPADFMLSYQRGENVVVKITRIDADRRRFDLSARAVSDSEEQAWLAARAVERQKTWQCGLADDLSKTRDPVKDTKEE